MIKKHYLVVNKEDGTVWAKCYYLKTATDLKDYYERQTLCEFKVVTDIK